MDGPVPAGLAGADVDTDHMPPLTLQVVLEGGLSMEEEVVAELDFCNSVIGGATSTFLSSTDGILDFAGDVTLVVSSPANLAGGITVGVLSRVDLAGDVTLVVSSPADLAGDVTVGVSPLADLAGDITIVVSSQADLPVGVTVGVATSAVAEVASSAVAEVASSADLAGDVTVGVASSTTAGVASLANIAEVASSADLAEVASSADLAEVACCRTCWICHRRCNVFGWSGVP